MGYRLAVVMVCVVSGGLAAGQRPLDIYFLDMSGGAATLIVTPLGESVLIDTGSREPLHRDADRICAACQDANVAEIDHLVTTHFHSDHYGALHELAQRMPIRRFYDKRAVPTDPTERKSNLFDQLYPLYEAATQGKVLPLGPGHNIALAQDPCMPFLTLHCVAAERQIEGFTGNVDAPVPGFEIRSADLGDNARSIALVLAFGEFSVFLGGDITWNVEHHLGHPVNRVGVVDLYQVTHHGLDQSNNPVLLNALAPTVCVAPNGPTKGIAPKAFQTMKALPSVQAIYQIHYNTKYGTSGNTALEFIANPSGQGSAWIKASVRPSSATFDMTIGPAGPTRTYPITATAKPASGGGRT